MFLKITIDMQTALVPGACPAEGQWLEEQLNMEKLFVFRAGTRILTASRAGKQNLAPLHAFI
jgi:hypothetical protein